ncbi:MAG: glycoside hydrolase family 10 protein [Candidatus Zipacnadales bacterium]
MMLTTALILGLAHVAYPYEVVILRPNQYLADNPNKINEVTEFLNYARAALDEARLKHHTIDENEALATGIPPDEFLLCAYNPKFPESVQTAISKFMDAGGHALFCNYLPDELRQRLKLSTLEYVQAGEKKSLEFIVRGPHDLPGQPKRVRQSSWNAHLTKPLSPEVFIAGQWLGIDGHTSPGAALLVGPEAAFLGHVLTSGDVQGKSALLISVISHYRRGTWNLVAKRTLEQLFSFRHAPDIQAFEKLCPTDWHRERLSRLKARAWRAELLRRVGRRRKAFERSRALRKEAEELYLACLPTRRHEFRGAWVVMPAGVGDWGWERTAQAAKQGGLDALFVRVAWRGTAHYKSQVLRLAEEIKAGEDPLAEAIKACHRQGLEIHAWFINHNWRIPPADLIEEFSKEGRWQIGPDGKEGIMEGSERVYWLNPSDLRNIALQAQMMAEVAREYEVDGVHFDYIRYENYAGSYGEDDRRRFETDTGLKVAKWPDDVLPGTEQRPPGQLHEEFLEWRVQQINNVVEACSKAVRAVRPDCKISAAVYPAWPSHRLMVGQDWPHWLREGWIDFVCPMNYDAPDYYMRHVRRVMNQREVAGTYPLYSGIGSWLQPDAVAVADQIVADRENGADGFVLFSLTPELAEDVLPQLRKGPLRR